MADTAALVVALSAQLTKFEKDMRAAGIMAEKAVGDIEDKFSKMNPKVSTSFLGNFFSDVVQKGISSAVDALKEFHKRFQDIEATAKLAAVSMNAVFGFQAALPGAGFDAVDKALVTLSALLDRAQRGEKGNALSTIFSVNDVALSSIRDAGEALFKVADIVSRLTPIQGKMLLEQLGLDPRLLTDLQKGEEHIRAIQLASAAAAPDLQALAEKAKEFDRLWEAAAKAMKGYLVEAAQAAMQSLREFIETTIRELRALESVGKAIGDRLGIQTKQGALGDLADTMEKGLPAPAPKRIEITGAPRRPATPFPVNTGAAGERDPFERAVDSIEKHTAATQANTQTVGLNVGEQERARVAAELLAVAQRGGATATAEQTQRMNAAAEAAGKARMEYEIAAGRLQKLNAASAAFGQALSNSFADAILEGKKLNDVMADLLKSIARMAINSTIMSLFTPGAGQTASPFASLFKAEGGPVTAGRPYIVGERGPELMIPNQGGMIVPNDALRPGSGGGGTVVYSPTIDARGASVEAVAKLAQIMEADRASFASRTVATIQQAKRGRVAGL